MKKEQASKKNEAKAGAASGKSKMPAGTPKGKAHLGVDTTTDPPVPNRAHTEM